MKNKRIKNRNRRASRFSFPYHGIFRFRIFLMKRFPKLYAKVFFKDLVRSRLAIRDALMMCKGEIEYRYARYLVSYLEIKQDKDKLLELIAKWIRKTGNEHLLRYLTDVFIFFNEVYIVTGRPGLWIGKGGDTLDDLRNFIRTNMSLPAITNIQLCELPGVAELAGYKIQEQKDFLAEEWKTFFNGMPGFDDFMQYLDDYVDSEEKPLWSVLQKEEEFETLDTLGFNRLF